MSAMLTAAAIALGGAAGAFAPGPSAGGIDKAVAPITRRQGGRRVGLFGGGGVDPMRRRRRSSGPGWTQRHAVRVAIKKRNKARNRAQAKGRSK